MSELFQTSPLAGRALAAAIFLTAAGAALSLGQSTPAPATAPAPVANATASPATTPGPTPANPAAGTAATPAPADEFDLLVRFVDRSPDEIEQLIVVLTRLRDMTDVEREALIKRVQMIRQVRDAIRPDSWGLSPRDLDVLHRYTSTLRPEDAQDWLNREHAATTLEARHQIPRDMLTAAAAQNIEPDPNLPDRPTNVTGFGPGQTQGGRGFNGGNFPLPGGRGAPPLGDDGRRGRPARPLPGNGRGGAGTQVAPPTAAATPTPSLATPAATPSDAAAPIAPSP